VRINQRHLGKVEARCVREEAASMGAFSEAVGRTVDPADLNRASITGPLLEDALGVKLPRTEKSGAISVKVDVLRSFQGNPAVDALLRAKKYYKLRTTFVESIRNHMTDGRIHCTFRQLRGESASGDLAGAGPGRLSSASPNLQQQPARDPEIGDFWRQLYLPDEGKEWACLDFSQQEPRWLIHFAELKGLPKAKEAAEQYRRDPSTDNHTLMTRMIHGARVDSMDPKEFKQMRTAAKTILLGMMYGMGGAKLCGQLGLPTRWMETNGGKMIEVAGPEGQDLIDKFNKGLPYVKMLAGTVEEAARKRGYIRTILGRRCRFPIGQGGKPEFTYKALNRLIQGSSADQTKKAMVDAADAGFELQLQVHDEFDLSIENHQQARDLAEIMRNAVPANVPFKVDIEIGPSWGEIKDIDG
jgi:DNA polymerase I-like protein with 3'-5' exonuclease and polymerase domains